MSLRMVLPGLLLLSGAGLLELFGTASPGQCRALYVAAAAAGLSGVVSEWFLLSTRSKSGAPQAQVDAWLRGGLLTVASRAVGLLGGLLGVVRAGYPAAWYTLGFLAVYLLQHGLQIRYLRRTSL